MRFIRIRVLFAFATLVCLANAQLITGTAGLSNLKIINFDNFSYIYNSGQAIDIGGPIQEHITWEGTGGIIGRTDAAFSGRGYWRSFEFGAITAARIGSNTEMRYTFLSGPVSAVGFFMNYTPNFPGTATGIWIEAFSSDHSLLASYNLLTDAPIPVDPNITLGNGAFRGISFNVNSIYSYSIRSDEGWFAMDNMTIARVSVSPVPEPSAMAAIAGGLLAVATLLRMRRTGTTKHNLLKETV